MDPFERLLTLLSVLVFLVYRAAVALPRLRVQNASHLFRSSLAGWRYAGPT